MEHLRLPRIRPTCLTIRDEIKGRVWIIAARDIAAGEERTYDYNLYDGDLDDPSPCSCGAHNCRGSMYSAQELARRAKALRRRSMKKKKTAQSKKPRA